MTDSDKPVIRSGPAGECKPWPPEKVAELDRVLDKILGDKARKGKTLKVSELTGPLLDLWVTRALGLTADIGPDGRCAQFELVMLFGKKTRMFRDPFEPSTDWNVGGPIFTQEGIALRRMDTVKHAGQWQAQLSEDNEVTPGMIGNTPLEAAMRVFVALHYGEEVPA